MKKSKKTSVRNPMFKTIIHLDTMVKGGILTVPSALAIAFSEGMELALCIVREKTYKSKFN